MLLFLPFQRLFKCLPSVVLSLTTLKSKMSVAGTRRSFIFCCIICLSYLPQSGLVPCCLCGPYWRFVQHFSNKVRIITFQRMVLWTVYLCFIVDTISAQTGFSMPRWVWILIDLYNMKGTTRCRLSCLSFLREETKFWLDSGHQRKWTCLHRQER